MAQSKIKTSGVSRTVPGLAKKSSGIRVPLFIDGVWRDPAKADLVHIENAKNENLEKIEAMSNELKAQNEAKKAAAEKAKFDKELAKALEAEKAKGENK